MPRTLVDEFGQRWLQEDSGEMVLAERAGLMAQAGRQVAELGGGIQELYGQVTGDDEMVARAQAEAAERNAIFRGTDAADPITSMVGQAIPSLATLPFGGAGNIARQVAVNAGIGAGESALDIGAGGENWQRGIAGGAAAVGGDMVGRVLGRAGNIIRGGFKDMRLGRGAPDSARAARAEEMGLELLESQRMTPGSDEQRLMQRLEQGAESSMFSPGLQQAAQATNEGVYRDAVLRAVGLPDGSFEDLGADALTAANVRLSEEFGDIAAEAASAGALDISEDLAGRIANTRGQVPDLIKRGRFAGLADGKLSGNEWNVARRALAQDAAKAAGKGEYELADDIFADVEELDRLIEPLIGEEALERFASAREQYRVLKIISKQGVINQGDQVSVRNLNRNLRAGTGFGDAAKQGRPTTNMETSELIELAKVGADPALQLFRSSGTAENLSAQRMAGMALDPTQWLSVAGEAAAPMVVGAASSRGGRSVRGALTPAPVQAAVGGQQVGRSILDEALYPFVGIEDERRP